MKTIRDFNVKNRHILVRCDFNIPLNKKRGVLDDFRLKETIPTIQYLRNHQAKIILMSHLGRPTPDFQRKISGPNNPGFKNPYSLKPIAARLEKLLSRREYAAKISINSARSNRVKLLPDCIGKEVKKEIDKMKNGDIVLLENLRLYKEEKENDSKFGKELSKLADIFINDAFGCCHRSHASIVSTPKYLPSGIGLLLEKELKILSKVMKNPKKPLVAIIGGVKLETKISLIKKLLRTADHLLLGGKIANVILKIKGICAEDIPLPDKKMIEEFKKLKLTNLKLHLPVDVVAAKQNHEFFNIREIAPGSLKKGEIILDIGSETVNLFSKIIKEAGTIIWNGPLGKFEEKGFEKGSLAVANLITKSNAFSIAGGGETVDFLFKHNLTEKFDYISTGGGAMLSFLGSEKLPGLEVLK